MVVYGKIIEQLSGQYRIKSIVEVSRDKIKANALIIKLKDQFEIYIDKDLPIGIKKFTILHEIGHVALGLITNDPKKNYSCEEEATINLWALEHYRCLLPDGTDIQSIKKGFANSEEQGFIMIAGTGI